MNLSKAARLEKMISLLSLTLVAQAGGGLPLPPLGYHAPDSVAETLRAIDDRIIVNTLATTPGGQPLEVVTFGATDVLGRPEILIVANCEGDRLVATETALRLCEHLAAGSPLLDVATVHVLPLANPDGAMAAFSGVDPWRGAPVDDDRDGFADEDGPNDLDGDGRALWMRVPTVGGSYFADPIDPRSSREADAAEGEAGSFLLTREGSDQDGDRVEQEDGLGGVRWDRNWSHRHRLHEAESGAYQLSEVETKALADFVLSRNNLALVIVLDDEDNLVSAPSGKDKTDKNSTEPLEDDAALLKLLGKRLDNENLAAPRSADHNHGCFADWVYFQRGVLVLESSVWSIPDDFEPEAEEEEEVDAETGEVEEVDAPEVEEADAPELDTDDLKMLAWLDYTYGAAGFAPWQTVEHPRHGTVEVGGWLPLLKHNPPAEELDAIGAQWAEFLDGLAGDLPRIRWSELEIEDLGGGVIDVRATLSNAPLMPTAAAMSRVARRITPIRVTIELPDGGELLSGRIAQSVEALDGLGGTTTFRWLLRIPSDGPAAQLRAISRTAGVAVNALEAK